MEAINLTLPGTYNKALKLKKEKCQRMPQSTSLGSKAWEFSQDTSQIASGKWSK